MSSPVVSFFAENLHGLLPTTRSSARSGYLRFGKSSFVVSVADGDGNEEDSGNGGSAPSDVEQLHSSGTAQADFAAPEHLDAVDYDYSSISTGSHELLQNDNVLGPAQGSGTFADASTRVSRLPRLRQQAAASEKILREGAVELQDLVKDSLRQEKIIRSSLDAAGAYARGARMSARKRDALMQFEKRLRAAELSEEKELPLETQNSLRNALEVLRAVPDPEPPPSEHNIHSRTADIEAFWE
ncbi:unnamed protein product [Amoebophrya sp. A25]|nr:unnamed protein product [Amoebophrya sp. A25]|eukprot:GSA25T00008458001.1